MLVAASGLQNGANAGVAGTGVSDWVGVITGVAVSVGLTVGVDGKLQAVVPMINNRLVRISEYRVLFMPIPLQWSVIKLSGEPRASVAYIRLYSIQTRVPTLDGFSLDFMASVLQIQVCPL
jgi:hypothetical protein